MTIPRISKKRLKKLGKLPFSSISKKPKPLRKRPRSKSERERIYGPPGFVEWIKAQPCVACGGQTGCDNAHIKNGGTGRKADWTEVVPLCSDYLGESGCHTYFHDQGRASLEGAYGVDLNDAKKVIQSRWLTFSGSPE